MSKPSVTTQPSRLTAWPAAITLSALAIVPFLFTSVPPLTDVPGHMGRFAVQTAPAGDGLFRDFAFHWTLVLNLASDLIVGLIHPWASVGWSTWLICAATAFLTTLGILMVSSAGNPRGAAALPWALLFVFNYPFLWGFINFALTLSLAMLAFAAWIADEARPARRVCLATLIVPMLLIGHGVAGIIFVGLVLSWEVGEALRGRWTGTAAIRPSRLAAVGPVVASAFATIVVWRIVGSHEGGCTVWLPMRKVEAATMMVRDQSRLLDEGTVGLCLAVLIVGWRWGARWRGGGAAAVLFAVALFVLTPSLISGSDRIDTRLAPVIPMLAFALQDWNRVSQNRRRIVVMAGLSLLLLRFAVTTVSFAEYGQRYRTELAALDHVPRGARILNLSRVDCPELSWRSERLEHLSNLSTLLRGAWVNSHWSISGLQLLTVRYVPSADYVRDPSHLVWRAQCIDFRQPPAKRDRHTLAEAMQSLPIDRADYLWLIGERLSNSTRDPRLRLVWADDISELYAIAA